jgi:hypothetical protein
MGAAALAWAASRHFIDSKTRTTLQLDGDLEVSFEEAGLGDAETSYWLSGNASTTVTYVTKARGAPGR